MNGLRLMMLVGLLVAPLAWAVPKVGPKDGMVVESLPPLGGPALMHEEVLPDLAFPRSLMNEGHLLAAQLEYLRLLPQLRGKDYLETLDTLATLSFRLKERQVGEGYLSRLTEAGGLASLDVLLARYAVLEDSEKNDNLMHMAKLYPANPVVETMQWAWVWSQARATGRVEETFGLKSAERLQQRLNEASVALQWRYRLAVGMAMIPGLGHAILGDLGAAIVLLLAWLLFGLAFFSACRHRHYAYAFVFVVPWVALWLNSPVLAGMEAEKQEPSRWQRAMESL